MSYTPSLADRIWNRACQGGGADPKAGDSALAGLLAFHGVAMNGGVLHACECLSPTQLREAIVGFRFFGYAEIADLVERAEQLRSEAKDVDTLEDTLNQGYWRFIPD